MALVTVSDEPIAGPGPCLFQGSRQLRIASVAALARQLIARLRSRTRKSPSAGLFEGIGGAVI